MTFLQRGMLLSAHTLQIETVTWTCDTIASPTCDLCNANDVQDEQTSFSAAPIHTRSLSTRLMRLCFIAQVSTMCLLF